MANRGRRFNPKTAFQRSGTTNSAAGFSQILKQARQSGQLNLSNRQLPEVPPEVWRINIDIPEESRNVSLGSSEDRWWDQKDLTKLILASNVLTKISDDIQLLSALSVLDLHDNRLTSLPDTLGTLINLKKLHINHNALECLPECLSSLTQLQCLRAEHNDIYQLSLDLGRLQDLEELDLSHNKLDVLPPSIGMLSRVMKLNVANNCIKYLPHEIGLMAGLRYLEATHNAIHTLPDEVGDLRQLEQLYLRHNRLTHIPMLTNCTALKELHLGNNALMGLTVEHLQCLGVITFLDLRDNKISRIPDEITLLQDLERLDVANNDLSTLPYVLGTLPKLKSIILDGNPMKSIRRDIIMRGTNELKRYLASRIEEPLAPKLAQPQGLRQGTGASGVVGGGDDGVDAHELAASKSLDYSGKKCDQVPPDLWEASERAGVTSVNLSKNLLSHTPSQLLSLKATLTELYLGFNKLTVLDPLVGELTKLYVLDLRNNQLSTLPDSLSSLKQLRECVISVNKFSNVPAVVYQFDSLEVLLASDNQIPDIDPKAVKSLCRLATLDLQNNDIMQVPAELGLCTQLRSLQLEGNPFRQPRPAILQRGTVVLLEYLQGRIVQ